MHICLPDLRGGRRVWIQIPSEKLLFFFFSWASEIWTLPLKLICSYVKTVISETIQTSQEGIYLKPILTCSYHLILLFQYLLGLPHAVWARGQAQAENKCTLAARSQARCMPPQVTTSQASHCVRYGQHPSRDKELLGKKAQSSFQEGEERMLCTRCHFKACESPPGRKLVTLNYRQCSSSARAQGGRPKSQQAILPVTRCVASGNHSKSPWLWSRGS